MSQEAEYWTSRYLNENTGWDIGYPSTPIKNYIDQLSDKAIKILIPGAGNAYEAEYLHEHGFEQVHVLDISALPLAALKKRVPTFPENHLHQGDFFEHTGQYDLILEQTFFCSFLPSKDNRQAYAQQMSRLLQRGAKLVGLWFDHTLDPIGKRPYGGNLQEYKDYFSPYFEIKTLERCYNSIKPRSGNELFGIFIRS